MDNKVTGRISSGAQLHIVDFLNGRGMFRRMSLGREVERRINTMSLSDFESSTIQSLKDNGMPSSCTSCPNFRKDTRRSKSFHGDFSDAFELKLSCARAGCTPAKEEFVKGAFRMERRGELLIDLEVSATGDEVKSFISMYGEVASAPVSDRTVRISATPRKDARGVVSTDMWKGVRGFSPKFAITDDEAANLKLSPMQMKIIEQMVESRTSKEHSNPTGDTVVRTTFRPEEYFKPESLPSDLPNYRINNRTTKNKAPKKLSAIPTTSASNLQDWS